MKVEVCMKRYLLIVMMYVCNALIGCAPATTQEKVTHSQPQPRMIAQQNYNDFTFKLKKCGPDGQDLRFEFIVTNNENIKRSISFNRHDIRVIDSEGNVYDKSYVEFGSNNSATMAAFVGQDLLYDIPVKAMIKILGAGTITTSVKAFQVGVSGEFNNILTFRDIPVDRHAYFNPLDEMNKSAQQVNDFLGKIIP